MKKQKKKTRGKKALPAFKKELSDFFFSEEGRIDKKTVAQVGLTLGLLATVFSPVQAHHTSSATPANEFYSSNTGGHRSGNSHGSHGSHTSHGSHGSHGQW